MKYVKVAVVVIGMVLCATACHKTPTQNGADENNAKAAPEGNSTNAASPEENAQNMSDTGPRG